MQRKDLTMSAFRLFVQRHLLASFFVLAFVLSWIPSLITWMLGVPIMLFPAGPAIAALIIAAIEGRSAWRELWSRFVHWRVGWRWYAVALFSPVPLFLVAVGLNTLLGAPAPTATQWATWPSLFGILASFLFIPMRGSWEEWGWRGYALPKLLVGRSALTASLVLGAIWGLWHLPMLITGQIHWSVGLMVIPLSIVFTWLYNHTGGSALLAFLLHATFDTLPEFFFPMVTGVDRVRLYWLMAILVALCAIVIVLRTGSKLRSQSTDNAAVRAEKSLALP
jgi:membrane protease YdiL (CAAX protease family)